MSTYKINPNKKTVPTTTIAKTYLKSTFVEGALTNVYINNGLSLTTNELNRSYGNKEPNSFFETMGEYINTSIRNGIYAPYLQKNTENKIIEGTTSDNFYTENVATGNYELSDFQKSKNISKQNFFTFYNDLQNRNTQQKQYIKPKDLSNPFQELSLQEYNFLLEKPEFFQNEESFDVLWNPDPNESLILSRYAAPDADGCGYCVALEKRAQGLTVELQLGVSFPSGDGPVGNEQGFPLVASSCEELNQYIADTLTSYSGTSIEIGYPVVWSFNYADGSTVGGVGCENLPDDVALAYSDTCASSVAFPENISYVTEIVDETYDSENECNAYNNDPATSGCYAWIPASGMSIYPVTGIPTNYAYCSDVFYLI